MLGTNEKKQLNFLMHQARVINIHNLLLMPYTMTFKTFLSLIDKLPWIVKEDFNESVKKGSREGILSRRILEKLLGNDKQNQLNFLMHQAKVIDRKTYITRALKTIPKPPTYSELTKNQRRAFEHVYSLVEEVVRIAAGSTSKEDQLKLLEDRWLLTHKAALKVTWKSLQSAIESLPNPKKHCDLSVLQRKHGQHMQRTSCLEALIKKIAQSDAVEDHIELTSMCLVSIHKQKPMPASFLTARHLPLYFEHLSALPAFTEPKQSHKDHYAAVKQLVVKIAGAEDGKTLSTFLKSIFPRALRNSWKTIFDDVDILKSGPSFKRYGHQLLKLIRKFTGENMEDYFVNNFPNVFTKCELSRPSAQDLMKLCNNIVDLRNRNESSEHILNFRRSVVSCFVSSLRLKICESMYQGRAER